MKVFLTMADTETRFRNLYSVEKIPKFTKVDSANKYTNLHFFSEMVKLLVVFFIVTEKMAVETLFIARN